MLKQVECVERFTERRKGRASSLLSTGEELLDHDWYVLARWEGEAILWNPVPYDTTSSKAIHAVGHWGLARAGFHPTGELAEEIQLPPYPVPFRFATVLRRVPKEKALTHLVESDERLPAARWEIGLWDVRDSRLIVDLGALGHPELGEVVFTLRDWDWLFGVDGRELLRRALLRARAQKRLHRVREEIEALADELRPPCERLGLMSSYYDAIWARGNLYTKLRALRELRAELARLLETPAALTSVLGR